MIIKHLFLQIMKDRYFRIIWIVFCILNGLLLFQRYNMQNTVEKEEQRIYDDYKGEITSQKIRQIIDGTTELDKKVKEGDESLKNLSCKTYSEYMKGNYNLYQSVYKNYKYAYEYKDFAAEMSEQYKDFKNRKLRYYYDYADENVLLNYDMYTLFCVLLAIYIGCKSVEQDREAKMFINLTLSRRGIRNVYKNKCISLILCNCLIVALFEVENIGIACLMGNLDGFFQPIYALEEYKKCLFSGSILSAWLMGMTGVAIVCILMCYLSMTISLVVRNAVLSMIAGCLLYAFLVVLYFTVDSGTNPIGQLAVGNSILDNRYFLPDCGIYGLAACLMGCLAVKISGKIDISRE